MKPTLTAIIVASLLIGGTLLFVTTQSSKINSGDKPSSVNTVSIVGGKQIIDIRAKGGYQPRKTTAKAGMPTIVRFNTSGTFDCSASVRIPSMNISTILPASGATEVDLGISRVGILQGSCGMGMYPFEIDFQS